MLPLQYVLNEAGQHTDAGHSEAQPPTDGLSHPAAKNRRDQCAGINPHVEKGEAGIAPQIILGVELAHYGADVAFQQAGAEHEQYQPRVEENRSEEHTSELQSL